MKQFYDGYDHFWVDQMGNLYWDGGPEFEQRAGAQCLVPANRIREFVGWLTAEVDEREPVE